MSLGPNEAILRELLASIASYVLHQRPRQKGFGKAKFMLSASRTAKKGAIPTTHILDNSPQMIIYYQYSKVRKKSQYLLKQLLFGVFALNVNMCLSNLIPLIGHVTKIKSEQ